MLGEVRQGGAGLAVKARCGKVGFGTVRCGAAWHGQVRQLRQGQEG